MDGANGVSTTKTNSECLYEHITMPIKNISNVKRRGLVGILHIWTNYLSHCFLNINAVLSSSIGIDFAFTGSLVAYTPRAVSASVMDKRYFKCGIPLPGKVGMFH